MATTFFWHDYETFGLNYTVDRPAQFAAIRTDANLQTIDKPLCIYCKPATDTMPSPGAVMVTGILPQVCEERGICEADFAKTIFTEMSREETISVGYNSMRFDDEVSRYMFWRNLYDPYSREWKDGCSRFDLFPLVVACWALRPEGIQWPMVESESGGMRPSFRLEHLSAANHLTHEHAHDALSDVQATIDVARLIREKNPKLWDFALANRDKTKLEALVNARKPLVWVSAFHGHERGYTRIVLPVGSVPGRKGQVLMFDLMSDPRELLSVTAAEAKTRMFAKKEDLSEGVSRLPVFTCKLNQAPFLVGHLGVLSDARAKDFGIDKEKVIANALYLLEHIETLQGLWREVFESDDEERHVDVDASLYGGGFTSRADRAQMDLIHTKTPQELADLVDARRIHFEDERFDELFFRYRARNWPQSLTDIERERWQKLRYERLMEGAGGARSLEVFAEEIEIEAEKMGEAIDERTEDILGALYDWAERMSESLDE